jgi:hypothetical protein
MAVEEGFLIVEVGQVIITVGAQRFREYLVGASRIRRRYIIPLSFIIIFINIPSIASLSFL